VLRRFVLPKPGQGPSSHERETGRYEVLFIGETAGGQTLRASVTGDRDPGYGSTSRMVAESALCLVHDVDRSATAGACGRPARRWAWRWYDASKRTPGSAFPLKKTSAAFDTASNRIGGQRLTWRSCRNSPQWR